MPKALVVHAIPGRVRLKFPEKRGDDAFFERLVALLSGYPKVDELSANPATGSLLIRHSASDEEFRQSAVALGLATEADFPNGGSAEPEAATRGAEASISSLALALLGALQLARGQPLAPASEHFWQALAMSERRMPQLAFLLAGLGVLQAAQGNLLGSGVSLLLYSFLLRQPAPASDGAAAGAE